MDVADYEIKVGDLVACVCRESDLVSAVTNYRGKVESVDDRFITVVTTRCDGYPKMIGKRMVNLSKWNFLPCDIYPAESNNAMWNMYIHDFTGKKKEKKKNVPIEGNSSGVVHPSHYNSNGKETIEKIKDMVGDEGYKGFLVGNIVKYIDRYPFKNGIEDIEKAEYYIGLLKKFETEKRK